MEILPFHPDYLQAAGRLFSAGLARLRRSVPETPDTLLDSARVCDNIARITAANGGLMALEHGELAGYMGWWLAEDFRGAGRKGAYVPEWAHAVRAEADAARIYRALYREAAGRWTAEGCEVHALTLLADDHAAERAWFWNGFGLLVVDGVRPTGPLEAAPRTDLTVRQATAADAAALTALDAEHVRHYVAPPVFMAPPAAEDAAAWEAFLARPRNNAWLALDGDTPTGFIRFAGSDYDGVELLSADTMIGINGAYVRPGYRGRHAAAATLDAGLRHYAALGFPACAVNFESFNPEAAGFWPRYFTPVCLSLMRMPENPRGGG